MTSLEDGYYAVHDPDQADVMTYWRVAGGALSPWPAKAWYGPPRPLKADAPKDREQLRVFVSEFNALALDHRRRTMDALHADPIRARSCFARMAVRCCCCGRRLTDDTSKVYGIGPECRAGIPADLLAQYLTPQVGRAHAAHLAEQPV